MHLKICVAWSVIPLAMFATKATFEIFATKLRYFRKFDNNITLIITKITPIESSFLVHWSWQCCALIFNNDFYIFLTKTEVVIRLSFPSIIEMIERGQDDGKLY